MPLCATRRFPNHNHWQGQQNLMKQATNVPNRGKHRAQVGQAPCPKWASSVPKTEPKVSIKRNTRKGDEKKRHLIESLDNNKLSNA